MPGEERTDHHNYSGLPENPTGNGKQQNTGDPSCPVDRNELSGTGSVGKKELPAGEMSLNDPLCTCTHLSFFKTLAVSTGQKNLNFPISIQSDADYYQDKEDNCVKGEISFE